MNIILEEIYNAFAGDVYEEILEIDKILSKEEYIEEPGTLTSRCTVILSVVCC